VFTDETRVYLLKIEYKKVEGDIKWEEGSCVPGATGGICNYVIIELDIKLYDKVFPHLYNDMHSIGKNELVSVVEWGENTSDNVDSCGMLSVAIIKEKHRFEGKLPPPHRE